MLPTKAIGSVDGRIPVLYLAPWVDIGGADTATIDWFRFLDHQRFRPSLIATQPSPNRRLLEVAPYAEELWELPVLMAGADFPRLILSFVHTRGIRIVHIMNSRLGFDLLPDIVSLPKRPQVVVQLHGEEPNQQGYVRYVATRYGNLVDAFSSTCAAGCERLEAYDVPIGRRRLIPLGVDAEREFSPERTRAIEGLGADSVNILFPARLTAQKDPLLMVEVAAELRARRLRFQIHVLGDGELMEPVREAVVSHGLEREVLLHGACVDMAPWYASCQIALLTSAFETSPPRVAYEAMAMEIPLVAPALPEIQELVTHSTGVLIESRRDVHAYANAICRLAEDGDAARMIGMAARAKVRSEFPLERMAAEHERLYDELLTAATRASSDDETPRPTRHAALPAIAFRGRQAGATPLVSVIITCFNQGIYLRGCLDSVARQSYESVQTIVVDDCSTDPTTLAALDDIERDREATVVRLLTNHGPAGARNAAIEHVRGRYVLPLDGDDLLLENAIADLVEQLESAGEQVGFIYPNLQFFGNRSDYVEVPSYNLYSLLAGNHCAAPSLIEREVFDRGLRYAEEITLGHEDWDFVLTMAEHGVYGEPARAKTVLCRKHGFSRSDLVSETVPFDEVIAARHSRLFALRGVIKAEWNPGLTLIGLDPVYESDDEAAAFVAAALRQTCSDFELVVPTSGELGPTELGPRLRRIPSEAATSRAEAVRLGLELSRGRYVLASYGTLTELLADVSSVEKTLRLLRANPGIAALAFADSASFQPGLRLLDSDAVRASRLGALCWTTTGPTAPPPSLRLDGDRPLDVLARWLDTYENVEWRHLPRDEHTVASSTSVGETAALGMPRHFRARDAGFWEHPPLLPECPPGVPYRLSRTKSWRPAQSRLLYRHRGSASGRYVYTNSETPPYGCVLDHVLGCVREYPLAGTTSLILRSDEQVFELGQPSDLDCPTLMGFVEQQPLPLLDPLLSGLDPATGERVLVAGHEDPLAAGLQEPAVVGYVEPYPIRPRPAAAVSAPCFVAGLVRTVDPAARRHRYGVGRIPPGLAAGELGALFTEPIDDGDPLWIDADGSVFAATCRLRDGRPLLQTALRWTGEPLTWRGFSSTAPKLRASARRAIDSARHLTAVSPTNGRPREPAGYLLRSPTARTIALYAAIHPVTGDQLLTTDPSEGANLGYRDLGILGHLVARATVTGKLGPIRTAAPWAAKFGMVETRAWR